MADQEHNSQNKNSCMLTPADFAALASKDDGYFNQKGARHYTMSNYTDAVQYYHIAAAMGNCDAISNLGYCYLYGRNMEQNTSLALAYFRIAASHGHIDALYKLGDIYSRDTWVTKDVELSTYYYLKAANFIVDQNWGTNPEVILAYTELQDYPSLCFALGRELLPKGTLFTNVEAAYLFLKHAEHGYQTFITNGQTMYEKNYKHVQELLAQSQFNDFRKKYSDVQE
jgi:hypothetical protein